MTATKTSPKPRFAISRKVLILSGVVVLTVAALVTLSVNTARLNGEVVEGNAKLAKAITQVEELENDAELAAVRLSSMREARDAYVVREAELQAKEEAVTEKENAVTGRENAVTATETAVQETTLKDGMSYTVGTSMQAGTYQTTSTSSRCYWKITQSGTNYGDIIENDLGSMGVLSVSVTGGQDFQSKSCGDWTKVG